MATVIKLDSILDKSIKNKQEYVDKIDKESKNYENVCEIAANDKDEGTYFIDEDGQLYFQPATGDNSAVTPENNVDLNENTNSVPVNDNDVDKNKEPEDVSYVYIVEQAEDDKVDMREENDITVYDFEEDNDENITEENPYIDIKKINSTTHIHRCPHCDFSHVKRIAVHKHMKVHSDKKPFKCSVCGKGFRSQTTLMNHENIHTGTKPFRCKICESTFTTSGEILRHIRYRHSKLRPHKCSECDYAAVELSKLRRHQRSHTGERPYQCPHCTYASPDTFKLKRHLRVHTGERPYKCDICLAAFSQSNSLKTHRLTHFPEKRPVFQCALCPVTCGRKADLRGHISKLHTSNKTFECKRCGKHFPDRYSYKTHVRTHNGEKSYKCPYCLYASISKIHLESHMYIHTDEKPYECDLCDYRSRQKQLLKRHKNMYHNPEFIQPKSSAPSHECEVCKKKFIHVGNLIKHLAIHDPESGVHEKKEALKIGRNTKVKVENEIDVPVSGSTVTITEDEDGQYVVYEMVNEEEEEEEEEEDDEEEEEGIEDEDMDIDVKKEIIGEKQDLRKDMENCFGFNEEDDVDSDD